MGNGGTKCLLHQNGDICHTQMGKKGSETGSTGREKNVSTI